MTLFSGEEQGIFCWFFLSLTHRYISELLVFDRDVEFGSNSLNFRRRVNSGEKYEEYGSLLISLIKCFEDVEGGLLNVSFSHNLGNIVSQSR